MSRVMILSFVNDDPRKYFTLVGQAMARAVALSWHRVPWHCHGNAMAIPFHVMLHP